jgi:hypothetical protein
MPRMRTSLLLTIALLGFGCGDDGNKAVDAPVTIDAPVAIDAPPPLTQDCPTYCTQIAATCTGANAQYAAAPAANCAATCAKFPVGAATDTSGNTLGCRLYHIQNITVRGQAADTHCNHAGPGGGLIAPIAAGGTPDTHCSDACTNFCALEVAACGTIAAGGANAVYQDMDACTTACAGFDRATKYTAPPAAATGNNLACRLYHVTNAITDPVNHCKHTALVAAAPCN